MKTVCPWVSQGDIFEAVPQCRWEVAPGSLVVVTDVGPALLVTHGCQLDKRSRSGTPQIKNLQFLPLLDVEEADTNRQAVLRRDDLQPPEVMYLGEMPGGWEAYVGLSEMYTMPAAFFEPRLEVFAGDPRADAEDPNHLVLDAHDRRLGRLSGERLRCLYDKMALFWMRMELP